MVLLYQNHSTVADNIRIIWFLFVYALHWIVGTVKNKIEKSKPQKLFENWVSREILLACKNSGLDMEVWVNSAYIHARYTY